jgi:hypothetical protein
MGQTASDVMVLARRLADRFEAAGMPYAIGGALALAQWSVPRGTKDVDLTLFVDETKWAEALQMLVTEGAEVDEPRVLDELRRRGSARVWGLGFPVDVFVPSIPFYTSVASRVVRRPLLGRAARFLSAEDLAVFKLLFFRLKDLADVQTLLAVRRADLDRDYVRSWLVDMVGTDDERVVWWDEMGGAIPS